jgi:sulfofructose kinase
VSERARLVCVGLAVADVVAHVDRPLEVGVKQFATSLTTVFGGPATTAAVAAARLGADVALIAPVGEDAHADGLRAALTQVGVHADHLATRPGTTTSTSLVVVSRDGERTIVNASPPELLEEPDAAEGARIAALVATADAVLVDVRWPGAARVALAAARAAGVPGVLDLDRTTQQHRGQVRELVGLASHVVGSRDAVRDVLDAELADEVATLLAGLAELAGLPGLAGLPDLAGERMVGVTDGAAGMWWQDASGTGHVPAFDVDVVETLGAGDVWHGAFAAGLAAGLEHPAAVADAAAAAALRCTRRGGWETLPDRDEVARLRATGRTRGRG